MGQPGVDVTPDALLQQAKVWEEASHSIGQIASTADGLTYPGNSGYFVDAVNAYDVARQDISIWCHSGQQEMHKIAGALIQATQTYHAAEHSNIQHVQNVH